MIRPRAILLSALTLAFAASGALAQQSTMPENPAADIDAERRAAVLEVLARDDVRSAARIADLDLDAAATAVGSLEGERLERAERQARSLERHLEAQDRISFSATTIIIILVLVAIIIVLV